MADQAGKNGTFAESALDQVYHNVSEKEEITKKNSSSDHYPLMATLKNKVLRKIYSKKIAKRCMKHFIVTSWNESLSKRNWNLFIEESNRSRWNSKCPKLKTVHHKEAQ